MSLSAAQAPIPSPGNVARVGQDINTAAAKQSQTGSMVNQYNPYGSLAYSADASSPSGYKATTTLSPAQEQLLKQLEGTQLEAGKSAKALVGGANYGASSPTDVIGDKTSGLTKQMMDSWWDANSRSMTDTTNQLDNQLRNQGLFPGSPGYDKAMMNLVKGQGEAKNSFLATAQPQAFSEASSLYQMPASLGGALASLGQPGSVNQSLVQTPGLNIQPVDFAGIQSNITNQQQQNAAQQNLMNTNLINALMSPIGAFAGGWGYGAGKGSGGGLGGTPWNSDRRLKKNIKPIGKLENGLPVYSFSYTWEHATHRIGLMADEVEKVHPEAVSISPSGFKLVDYELAVR